METTNEPDALRGELIEHAARRAEQSALAAVFIELLDDPDSLEGRGLARHCSASAWLVDGAGQRVVLTHHRKLDRWRQLGGHADGDRDLARSALREAEEESGLSGLRVVPGIFDLDRHMIPEHKGVPAHWHYDVRYVVVAGRDEDFAISEESLDLAWRDCAAAAASTSADHTPRPAAARWLARTGKPL